MEQFDTLTYGVKPGEKITLTTHLLGLPPTAVQVSDTMTQGPNTEDGSPTWSFIVGTEDVYDIDTEVSFVDAPSSASAVITVEGSRGGGPFSLSKILPTSAEKGPIIQFQVDKS
jgi:hypothetical protein